MVVCQLNGVLCAFVWWGELALEKGIVDGRLVGSFSTIKKIRMPSESRFLETESIYYLPGKRPELFLRCISLGGTQTPALLQDFVTGLSGSAWLNIVTTYGDASGNKLSNSLEYAGSTYIHNGDSCYQVRQRLSSSSLPSPPFPPSLQPLTHLPVDRGPTLSARASQIVACLNEIQITMQSCGVRRGICTCRVRRGMCTCRVRRMGGGN